MGDDLSFGIHCDDVAAVPRLGDTTAFDFN
jgi:hypothetical protein